jgi:hypothetical protein
MGKAHRNCLEETSVPFKSEAQRRYFEANKSRLKKQGVDVKEWEESSRGLKLPERAPKTKNKKSQVHLSVSNLDGVEINLLYSDLQFADAFSQALKMVCNGCITKS